VTGPVGPTAAAHLTLRPLPAGSLTVTAGFWARRQAANRAVSIPSGWGSLEQAGTLGNFRAVAAGGDASQQTGPYFVDTDLYKWLEAAGWELGRGIDDEHTSALSARVSEAVSLVQAAQAPDGYLDTWFQLRAPSARFTDLPAAHELYCAGHLMQAAVALHRALGDDRLLAVARGFAGYLAQVFGPSGLHGVPGHPEVEMALVELYRATLEQRYLDLARYFVDARGHRLLGEIHHGSRYRQDDEPFRIARHARGHAVRAAYLACGALDVSAETGDQSLLSAAAAQWDDMVAQRMYLTGGVGSRHKDEAFGDPYELPPDRAYCETCAAIGVIMWSWRLLLATGDCRYADVIERVLFNGFIVSTSLDGGTSFYVNPLQVRTGRLDPEDGRGTAARSTWYQIACCPPNVMRTLSSLPHYFATASAAGVQLWQYAAGRLSAEVAGGRLSMVIDTDYPLSGSVIVRLLETPAREFDLSLRVPAWAAGATGTIRCDGGAGESARLTPGQPWTTRKVWQPGDELHLDLPLSPRITRPHPRIDAVRGCVAVERGPLVYCLEQADVPDQADLESLLLQPFAALEETGGLVAAEPVVLIRGSFGVASPPTSGEFPYRATSWSQEPAGTVQAALVPYFAWGNRHPGQTMRVWIPLTS
jgi:uncharacterized protein